MGEHAFLRVTNNVEKVARAILDFSDEEFHGYAVMKATKLNSGQVYRILWRYKDLGWIEEIDAGPHSQGPRISYRVRPEGLKHLKTVLIAAGPDTPAAHAPRKIVPIKEM